MYEPLARKQEPVLRWDRNEDFYPLRSDEYVCDCSLRMIKDDQRIMYIPPRLKTETF